MESENQPVATSFSEDDATALEHLRSSGRPVVIFGASIVGEALYRACLDEGIEVQGFCDNNSNNTKEVPGCEGLAVVPPDQVRDRFGDAVFLISSTYIREIAEQLKQLGFSDWVGCRPLLKDFDVYQHEWKTAPAHYVEFFVGACLLSHAGYLHPEQLYVRGIDIVVTERCSMKCRDCSNLMQYYTKPINVETSELLTQVETLLQYMDEVYEFRLIGGEAMMHRDWPIITERLVSEPKVKKVVIYSNGTIPPRDRHFELLKDPKILFIFTDYGKLSRSLDRIKEDFDREGIAYFVQEAEGWTDCASIDKHNDSIEMLKEKFSACCVKNFTTLSDDKIYRCPFAANAARLNAVPDYSDDYIALADIQGQPSAKEDIRSFLLDKDYLDSCDHCNGRAYGSPEIEPGIQVSEPLPYTRYDS